MLKKAELEIEEDPENLFKFCLRVTLSIEVSLKESEEIFLTFFCNFSSYSFFFTYSSFNSLGSSILGVFGSSGSVLEPEVTIG